MPPGASPIELYLDTQLGEALDFEAPLTPGMESTTGTEELGADQDFAGLPEIIDVDSSPETGSKSGSGGQSPRRKKPRQLS